MKTCPCPREHCGHPAALVYQHQETGWYHCGLCGTLAAKVGDEVRVRCLPIYGERYRELESVCGALVGASRAFDARAHCGIPLEGLSTEISHLHNVTNEAHAVVNKPYNWTDETDPAKKNH